LTRDKRGDHKQFDPRKRGGHKQFDPRKRGSNA
jgi:hypothetical protein